MENEKSTLSPIGKIFDWLGKAFLKTTPGKLFALFVKIFCECVVFLKINFYFCMNLSNQFLIKLNN